MRRVLVTRPEPGASRTASKVAAGGFEPVLLPLTKTVPLPLARLPNAGDFAAVAVTSANAVRHAPPALLRQIAHIPLYAVGEKTGAVAHDAGLTVARSDAGDADRLARQVSDVLPPSARLLLLCGRVRRDTLEAALARTGRDVMAVETYDTMDVAPSEEEIKAALAGKPIDVVLLYSAVAAGIFAGMVGRSSVTPLFEHAIYLAISARVAAMLPAGARVEVSTEPTEEAMLSLLTGRNERRPL